MNKSFLEKIKDTKARQNIFKIVEKINRIKKTYIPEYTDFLDPYELNISKNLLDLEKELKYSLVLPNEEFERNIILIKPWFIEDEEDISVEVFHIKNLGLEKNITHKDVLGSLLGLGVVREKIGDLQIFKNDIQIFIKKDISDYIFLNLEKISRYKVSLETLRFDERKRYIQEFKYDSIVISSPRLDSILSSTFNLSRLKAKEIIKSEKVKVNYEIIDNPAKVILEGSKISVRGFGRFIFDSINSRTKSDRYHVTIRIYQWLGEKNNVNSFRYRK